MKCPFCEVEMVADTKDNVKFSFCNIPIHVCDKVPITPGIWIMSKDQFDKLLRK